MRRATAIFAIVLLGSCGTDRELSSPGASDAGTPSAGIVSPTPAASATTMGPAATRIEAFSSPSKNIGCAYFEGTMRCDVLEFSYTPPQKPADCDLDWGTAVVLDEGGSARFVCAGDTVFDPDAPILGYGEKSRVGSILCDSSEAGIRCYDEGTANGFELSKARYRIF